jgi:hypothetical protein
MSRTAKRIILHAGLHKTGTTAIQDTLAAGNEELMSQGWKYPIFTDIEQIKIVNHSSVLYTLFCDDPSSYLPNLIAGVDGEAARQLFNDQLQAELESDYNLILSGEDVSALPEHALRKLANALAEYELEVVVVVREAYSYLCSHLQHRIHRGMHGIQLAMPSLRRHCVRLAHAFPSIQFLSYEQACNSSGGVFASFMSACGLDPSRLKAIEANVSIGNHTARFLASFNEHFPLMINNKPNPGRPVFDIYQLDFDPFKFALTREEFENVKDRVRAENEALSLVTGLTLEGQGTPRFSDEHPFTLELALALLEKASAMPEALMNHSFRYVADQKLGPVVWEKLTMPTSTQRRFPKFWKRS